MDELHDPDKRPWISEVLRPAEILAEYQSGPDRVRRVEVDQEQY